MLQNTEIYILTNSEVLFIAQIPYQLYVEVIYRTVSLSIELLEFDVGKVRFQHVKCQQLKGAIISSSSSSEGDIFMLIGM